MYNKISCRANSEYDILLDETDIDSIIKGEKTDYDADIVSLVREMTKTYMDDLLGALLLTEYLEKSGKVGKCIFIEDVCANTKGDELLYGIQKKGR